jgi:formate dehydrogenase major subunit
VPGLGTSFGRGGATTAQQDLQFADAILIMGSSMAENHPVGFQWVMAARERGARIIHVDPRFSRTSAMADIWVPLRAGSDIVFLGGLIHYVLENDLWFHEYVERYTNAATIIREGFQDTEDLAGLFSGWVAEEKKYSPETWLYEGSPDKDSGGEKAGHEAPGGGHGKDRGGEGGDTARFETDETLQHPRCVFQILKKHFSRYTPEMVERACGVPRDVFLKAAQAFCSAAGREKTGAICYAVGWTQHSKGPQIIRAASILQLLLGNIGRPGGGILALRGHASIQGSTDIPTLYDILPGYLPMPFFESDSQKLAQYIKKHSARTGVWAKFDHYIVSLLRAWYGDAADKDNDWRFEWLPRVTADHSEFGYWLNMMDGKVEGLFVMGQNPAVGAPNARFERKALSKLKWLVVRDMVETETASFWYDSPEVARGELKPRDIATEVFLMPAAGSAEKDGCFTNTQRLVQFHNKAVDPPGEARSESWFVYHLGRKLKQRAQRDPSARNQPLIHLTWDYPTHGKDAEPVIEAVVAEINGYTWPERQQIENYDALKNDGSTACGCWIYSGIMPGASENKANNRHPQGRYGHGWGFSWPKDVRVLYNRASAAPDGQPWSERKSLLWWDAGKKQWTGHDTPDFKKDIAPDHKGDLRRGHGLEAIPGDRPFIMHPDGTGWLFVSSGLKDGPLPTHYEPLESPIANPLYPKVQDNPAAEKKERPDNAYAFSPGDERFPYVLTSYRLTEHHTAGGMSRHSSHLAELQPELFCEVSPELAGEVGLEHGGWATITSARGIVSARVLVTPRMRPLWIEGRRLHQVALPYHWGYRGLVLGEVVNDLFAISEEPNVRIMETKAALCNVEPGRTSPRAALREWKQQLQERV